MAENTPVKVYCPFTAENNTSSCLLCGFNFALSGTRPAYRIFGQLKSSSESDFLEKIRQVLHDDLFASQSVLPSSVSCKSCHSKVYRLAKNLKEIEYFRDAVKCRLGNVFETVTTENSPPGNVRVKRCSKSPHQSGPPLKMLQTILPAEEDAKATKSKFVRELITVGSNNLECLPFKNAEIPDATRGRNLTSVDVSSTKLLLRISYTGFLLLFEHQMFILSVHLSKKCFLFSPSTQNIQTFFKS